MKKPHGITSRTLQRVAFTLLAIIIMNFSVRSVFARGDLNDIEDDDLVAKTLRPMQDRLRRFNKTINRNTQRANGAATLSHHANEVSTRAFDRSNEAIDLLNDLSDRTEAISEEIEKAERVKAKARKKQLVRNLKDKIELERVKIKEKSKLGIYEQAEKIRAQASVEAEESKWDKIKEIMTDSKPLINIVLAITGIALSIYTIKYGMSALMNYVARPHVISETSQDNWFGLLETDQSVHIDDLIFAPTLKKQLFDLALRIESAQMYNENLPNVLCYGAPGTGKTSLVRALAYYSGLDYALTSGSEFAKITNLNDANKELRKLLNWAKKSNKGLIIFIDEAESLFANKKLQTTSQATQDFINTFLALVPERSQKNIMFILATNHPFKLDDAVINRMGINIELPLPESSEREKILALYLNKFAQENPDALVSLHPEVLQSLPTYTNNLGGISPRALKFLAEEMIVAARRRVPQQLTHELALKVLIETQHGLQEAELWQKERDQWASRLAVR